LYIPHKSRLFEKDHDDAQIFDDRSLVVQLRWHGSGGPVPMVRRIWRRTRRRRIELLVRNARAMPRCGFGQRWILPRELLF
jgi:hypothetical protein